MMVFICPFLLDVARGLEYMTNSQLIGNLKIVHSTISDDLDTSPAIKRRTKSNPWCVLFTALEYDLHHVTTTPVLTNTHIDK